VAVVGAMLGGGVVPAAASQPAQAQAPLPELGHWRNQPNDITQSVGYVGRMEAAEAAYGEFDGHWRTYHDPGHPPMNDAEIAAAEAGKELHISWRPRPAGANWAYTASGAYDGTIDRVMTDLKNHCGDNCWLSIEVEPENNVNWTPGSGFTPADFRGMWQRVAESRERVGADNVQLVWVVQGYDSWRPLYDNIWPGNDVVDIVGHDPYISKDGVPERLGQKMVNRTRWLVNNSTDHHDYASKPFLIAEYGCDINTTGAAEPRGSAEHRAACLNGVQAVLGQLARLGVIELEYFDARTDWLNDPPAIDGEAYRQLKEATEAG
jgi:hypothetical protein